MIFVPTVTDLFILLLFSTLFLLAGWLTTGVVVTNSPGVQKQLGSNTGEAAVDVQICPSTTNSDTRFTLLEYLLLIPLTAIVMVSLILLITAELGFFRFRVWLLLLFLYDTALAFKYRAQLRSWGRFPFSGKLTTSKSDLLLVPLALLACFLFRPVSEFVTTQRDPGEYVNIAVKVAETGSLRFVEPGFVGMNAPEKENLTVPVSFREAPFQEVIQGFYLVDPARGLMLPQYFHLFPLWLALGFKLWRFAGMLSLNGVFGSLSLLALVVLGCRLFESRTAGWMAGLLLVVSPAQIWIVRSPFSEILAQLFLLSGLWALTTAIREKHSAVSLLAGILLGLSGMVRLDSILVIGSLLVFSPVDDKRFRQESPAVSQWGILVRVGNFDFVRRGARCHICISLFHSRDGHILSPSASLYG